MYIYYTHTQFRQDLSVMVDCASYIYARTQIHKETYIRIYRFIPIYLYIHIHARSSGKMSESSPTVSHISNICLHTCILISEICSHICKSMYTLMYTLVTSLKLHVTCSHICSYVYSCDICSTTRVYIRT